MADTKKEKKKMSMEILDQKMVEKALSQKNLLFKSILESSPVGCLIVNNCNDEIIFSNKQFYKIWEIEHLEEKITSGQLKKGDIIPNCMSLVANIPEFIQSCSMLENENIRNIIEDEIPLNSGKTIRRFSCQVRDEEDNYIGSTYIFEDITETKTKEYKLMEERLSYTARYDQLTSVANRYYLEEVIRKIYCSKECKESALLVIDLDNFKIVNDTYGHEVGDLLLVKVATFIKSKIREDDFIARLSGDGFAIVFKCISLENSLNAAQRLLRELNKEIFYIDEYKVSITISASIGVTLLDDAKGINRLFSYADAALFEAKEKGKNRAVALCRAEDKIRISKNNKILALIHDALRNDRFILHLQPIYKANNKVVHQEILLRMLDDNDNVIFPAEFIPLAERYGLMPLIDKWVVRNSLAMLAHMEDFNIFINVSGSSLSDDVFLEWIEDSIKESGINPERIGFEITETAAIKDLDKTERWICKLQALGCFFALDDFGVGFSSFSYLNMLPVNYLKIDGSFVQNLDSDPTKLALVQAMNGVAHALGKQTIAEFVENEAIWKILNELGVDCGQGYYLGRPMPI